MELSADAVWLKSWLLQGMHGEMGYMDRNFEKRIDPSKLVPESKSVISILVNYFPGNPEISTVSPKISRYALSADYHFVVKDMLFALLEKIREQFGAVNGRAFVDSAPVLERSWAVKSGLGWIGKSSMLVNPSYGTFTFLGQLIVDIEIEPSSTSINDRCGTCTRCIDACPTGAIVKPYVVDARKCISYLTIEKKDFLVQEEKELLAGWCFGCDICQEVCPWNSRIQETSIDRLKPKHDIISLSSDDRVNLSEEQFESVFGKTSVLRAGYKKFSDNTKANS